MAVEQKLDERVWVGVCDVHCRQLVQGGSECCALSGYVYGVRIGDVLVMSR
jgi:hypothetical protein